MRIFVLSFLIAFATALPVIEPQFGGQDVQIIGPSITQPQPGLFVEDAGRIITPEVNILSSTRTYQVQPSGTIIGKINEQEGLILENGVQGGQLGQGLTGRTEGVTNGQVLSNEQLVRSELPQNNIGGLPLVSSTQVTGGVQGLVNTQVPLNNNLGRSDFTQTNTPINGLPLVQPIGSNQLTEFTNTQLPLNTQLGRSDLINTNLPLVQPVGPTTFTGGNVLSSQTGSSIVTPGLQRSIVPTNLGSTIAGNTGILPIVQTQGGVQQENVVNEPVLRSSIPVGTTFTNIPATPQALALQTPQITVPAVRGQAGLNVAPRCIVPSPY